MIQNRDLDSYKVNVKAASTTHVDLTTVYPIVDGYQTEKGDRILLKDQIDAKQNGIYKCLANGLSLAFDMDNNTSYTNGAITRTTDGVDNINKEFYCPPIKPTEYLTTAKNWIESPFIPDATPPELIFAADLAAIELLTGEADKQYIAEDTGNIYRWNGSSYVEMSQSISTSFEGTNWSFVKGDDTHANNALQLQAAYDAAKLATPNGLPLSSTNRFTVMVGAGYYSFASDFIVDTEFIDIVSVTGNMDIIFNSIQIAGTISVTANDVYIRGIDVSSNNKSFNIADNLNLLTCEKCKGSYNNIFSTSSFGGGNEIIVSGTFIDCEGGDNSFGHDGTASGRFIRCKAGVQSFSESPVYDLIEASGYFEDCEAGDNSFGGSSSRCTGTFVRCKSGQSSFGGGNYGIENATFIDCKSYGQSSFVGVAINSVFENCESGNLSFRLGSDSLTKVTNCVAGNDSFGFPVGAGNILGTYINCTAGNNSFNGILSGTFKGCVAGNNSFANPSGSVIDGATFENCKGGDASFGSSVNITNKFISCIGGNNSFGGQGGKRAFGLYRDCVGGDLSFGAEADINFPLGEFYDCIGGDSSFGGSNGGLLQNPSGTFNNCIGGAYSFGGDPDFPTTLEGKYYYCKLTSGLWANGGGVGGAGKIVFCIDGNDNPVNEGFVVQNKV